MSGVVEIVSRSLRFLFRWAIRRPICEPTYRRRSRNYLSLLKSWSLWVQPNFWREKAGTRPAPTGPGEGMGRSTAAAGGQGHIAFTVDAGGVLGEGALRGRSPRTREAACGRPPKCEERVKRRESCWFLCRRSDGGQALVRALPEDCESSPSFWNASVRFSCLTPSWLTTMIRLTFLCAALSCNLYFSPVPI